jgi:phage-related baseplate assembly protein
MPTFSLAELMKPLSTEQVRSAIYRSLSITGTNTAGWKPGAVVRTIITGSSIVGSALSNLIAYVANGAYLQTATGSWLKLKAFHDFNVTPPDATFATGTVILNNAAGGIFPMVAEEVLFSNPDTGKTYRNIAAFNLGSLQVGLPVTVRATEAGSASTSLAGTIVSIESPTMAGVSCSNPEALIGTDAADDPAVRTLCSDKLGSLSPNGPKDAYAYAARNARLPDGTTAGVTRVRVKRDGYGFVYIYAGTASGALGGDVNNPSTPLGAVAAAIYELAEPEAVTAIPASAVPRVIPVTYSVRLYNTSGLTQAQIRDAIAAKLVTFFTTQPIGGNGDEQKLYHDAIRTAIGSTLPEIFHVEVTSPAGDTVLDYPDVPMLGDVTATEILQSPPGGL